MAAAGAAALLSNAQTASEHASALTIHDVYSANTTRTLTEISTVKLTTPTSQTTPQWLSSAGTPATINIVQAPVTNACQGSSTQADQTHSTFQNCQHKTRWERFGHGLCTSCNEVKGKISCTRCGLAICFKCQRKLLPHHSQLRKYGKRPEQPGYEGPYKR